LDSLSNDLVAAACNSFFEFAENEDSLAVAICASILGMSQVTFVFVKLILAVKDALFGTLFPPDPVARDLQVFSHISYTPTGQ
jgi:hypothetical protein